METCQVCGKAKGQPPNCNGHYQTTMEKLTPTQDALRPIPDEAIDALRKEWTVTGLGKMTYPQWCEREAIFARRLTALLVNGLSRGFNGAGNDTELMELLQTAAVSSVAWIATVAASSATIGTEPPT